MSDHLFSELKLKYKHEKESKKVSLFAFHLFKLYHTVRTVAVS